MKQLFGMLLLLLSMTVKAQMQVGTLYYSDKYGAKQVADGPYIKELKKVNDSVVSETFSKTKNGQLIWSKAYLGTQPYGIWKWYDKSGNVTSMRNYDFVLKYGEVIPENAIRLTKLGIDPKSDENMQIIQKHIVKNFRYPEIAQEKGIQGKVTIQFTIDENGNVDNLSILEGAHEALDTECFRIMSSLKQLKPYKMEGKEVMVYYTMPINFKLA